MTQAEFKSRFENTGLPFGLASQTLQWLHFDGITSKDVSNCEIKYAIVKEPGKPFVQKTVIGYANTFAEAQALLHNARDEEVANPMYRKTELRYDEPTWCKIRTIKRGSGEINTYDFSIIDIPYVLQQYEHGKDVYQIQNTRRKK